MASPEKRAGKLTGHWYGEVDRRHKPGGIRFRARFETKKEAEGYEAYIKATGEAPPWLAEGGVSGHTFASVARDCRANHRPWARGKDSSGIRRLEFLIDGPLGKLPLEGITRERLEKLVGELKSRGMAGSTANRYLAVVSTVFTYATKDVAKYGRVTKPTIPWQDEGEQREETVSFEQEDAICRVLAEQGLLTEAFLVKALAATGMRTGELMGLKPEQIEHERVKLKAADTKTKASRLIYIDPEMARELRALVAAGKLPRRAQLWKVFKAAVKACGYSEELCLHSLRHTRATRLLESGVDPQVTMQIMGWTSFSTMQRYRHVTGELQREAVQKVSHRRGEQASEGVVLPFAAVEKTA